MRGRSIGKGLAHARYAFGAGVDVPPVVPLPLGGGTAPLAPVVGVPPGVGAGVGVPLLSGGGVLPPAGGWDAVSM
jgi:hypothetical protein